MSARINYNRITGSNIQGEATTVTEPLGTLVVTNNGELRLHDGTTQGGVAVGGAGGASGWQLTSGTSVVSLNEIGDLTLPEGGVISNNYGVIRLKPAGASTETQALLIYPTAEDGDHVHLTAGGGTTDLYLGNDDQFVKVDHSGTVVVQTYSIDTTSTWTFGTDGTLTLPDGSGVTGGFISGAPGEGAGVSNGGTGYQQFFVQGDGAFVQTSVDNSGTVFNTWQFGTDGSFTAPGPIYGGSNTIGLVAPAPLNLNNTGPIGQVKTQLNLINTAGNAGTGSAVDYFTYVDQGNGLPGARLQAVDDNAYSANFSIALKGKGNTGNNGLTTVWTFGSDGSTTFPNDTILGTGSDPNVYIQTLANGSTSTWTFGTDSQLTLPKGGIISETTSTVEIAPPSANPGQSLMIRPTASTWSVTASNYITYGSPITVTVNQTLVGQYFGTVNYEITGPGVTEQSLGRPLTGHVVITRAEGQSSQPVTWTIPANSNISEFTFTLTTVDGTLSTDINTENDPALYYSFEENALPAGYYVTVTNNGISSLEASHIHLVAGDPTTVDLYLGDDDQYVKIEKDHGNVVIGTTNFNGSPSNVLSTWTFGTDGSTSLASGVEISNSSDLNFVTWNTGSALILTDTVNLNPTSFIYIPSSSDTVSRVSIANTNTTGGVILVQGPGDSQSSLEVNGGGVSISTIVNNFQTGAWQFSSTGTLKFPDNTQQTTAYTGGGIGPVFQLTSGTAVVSLAANGTLTFPNNDLTISSISSPSPESRIWTTDSDITVYRNGRDGYGVKESEVTVFAGNGQIAKFVPTGLEIASGKSLKFPDATVQTTAYIDNTPPALAGLLSTATTIAITAATAQGGPSANIDVTITNHQVDHYGSTGYTGNVLSTGLVVIPDTTQSPPIAHTILQVGSQSLTQSYSLGANGSPAYSHYVAYAYVVTPFGTVWSAPTSGQFGSICLIAGTMILLSDGTRKAIEDITYTDKLQSWNFDQGCYAETTALWIKQAETGYQYNLLTFSDGTTLRTFDQHRIFNKEAGAFTYPMTDATPIGTTTVNEHGQEITLVDKQVIQDTIEYYNVITDYHMNLFSDTILTSCRFNNIYPITDMKFVKDGRTPRTRDEFADIPDRFFYGLRLAEQTTDIETVEWYVTRLLALEESFEAVAV